MSTNAASKQLVELGSPDRFGYEWGEYREILPESREQLERWLGPISLASFSGRSVLDVGCGMGRNPYWMLRAGASRMVAVDVDERSLASATRNLTAFPNAEVRKASAYDLNALDERFDRVTCIGVLHHLADPEKALDAMWERVAPGGELILWCYGNVGNGAFLPIIQGLRAVGSRLPLPMVKWLARALAAAAWPAFRWFPWRTEYYRNLRRLSFRNVESIIFDQLIPRIARYWSRTDMEKLASRLANRFEVSLVQGNSWNVRIQK